MDNSKTDNNAVAPQRLHYTHVLATVYFYNGEEVAILDTQFFSTSDKTSFNAQRLNQLQNVAAQQIKGGQDPKTPFQCLEVHIKGLIYLGEFTPEEFWAGMESAPGAIDAGVGTAHSLPVAAGETATPDNVIPLKPNGLAAAVNTGLDTQLSDAETPPGDGGAPLV